MRQPIMAFVAAAMLALAAGASNASAQSVRIYVGPGMAYDDDYAGYYQRPYRYERPYRYGPRVYGYSSDNDDIIVRMSPRRRAGCGTYHYWDGDRCADARFDPPSGR